MYYSQLPSYENSSSDLLSISVARVASKQGFPESSQNVVPRVKVDRFPFGTVASERKDAVEGNRHATFSCNRAGSRRVTACRRYSAIRWFIQEQ